MLAEDPFMSTMVYETGRFYDVSHSVPAAYLKKKEPLLRARTRLSCATEEIKFTRKMINIKDLMVDLGGGLSGLVAVFGCFLAPCAKCQYEKEEMEKANGVELTCCESC